MCQQKFNIRDFREHIRTAFLKSKLEKVLKELKKFREA